MFTPTLDLITTPFGAQLTPLGNAYAHNVIADGFEVQSSCLLDLHSVGMITDAEYDRIMRLDDDKFLTVRTMLCAFYLLACGEDF